MTTGSSNMFRVQRLDSRSSETIIALITVYSRTQGVSKNKTVRNSMRLDKLRRDIFYA
jgi:hypothetical protein